MYKTIWFFALGLSIYACSTTQKKVDQTANSINRKLYDSIQHAWNTMMADDDEKFFHINRLLDEITYTNNYDSMAVDSLRRFAKYVKGKRYDQKSMADSEKIDEYDSLNSLLVNRVLNYAAEHPDFKRYPLMEELSMDIKEAENRVLMHRIHYDNFVLDYNKKLDSADKQLEETPQKLPVFRIN